MRSLWFDTHPIVLPIQQGSPPESRYDSVVAGAGLSGLTTALLLARAGQRVAVLEARHVGAAATGNTTAKVSLLQGTNLSSIRAHRSDEQLRAYIQANQEGQAWLLRYLDEHGLPYQRRTAYTYANHDGGIDAVERELEACHAAGVRAEWTEDTELPHPVAGAIKLGDQAQIHPTEVLGALAAELLDRGVHICEGVRVTGAGAGTNGTQVTVQTSQGDVHAEQLVVATGSPILDRGGYFAKMTGHRSYAQAFRLPDAVAVPQGMYLSVDQPSRSIRSVPSHDGEMLLVGGNGHQVGRADSHSRAVEDLTNWTSDYFPGAERTHAWSAQDYRPVDFVPFFGAMPRGNQRIYVATGYNKWGMTNAVAAALAISAEILDGAMSWATVLSNRSATAAAGLTAAKENIAVGARMGADWGAATLSQLPDSDPAEGEGVVGRVGAHPVGSSTVGGRTRQVSAVCPHMGGVLSWNDAECTWDCPLHASRFTPEGTVLEGPAVKDLARHDSP